MKAAVENSVARLHAALADLDDRAVRAPSGLPGWSRGHVLTHVANFSEAMTRQVDEARAGRLIEMYDGGRPARDTAIEAGAGRPADELKAHTQQTGAGLLEAWSKVGPRTHRHADRSHRVARRALHRLPGRGRPAGAQPLALTNRAIIDRVEPDPELRAALTVDRAGTAERITALAADLETIMEASRLVATDDEHDPEGSTIAFERSQTTKFLDDAHKHLANLDSALERLDAGGYGTCETCGNPIAPGRLLARPSARTCITCAS